MTGTIVKMVGSANADDTELNAAWKAMTNAKSPAEEREAERRFQLRAAELRTAFPPAAWRQWAAA